MRVIADPKSLKQGSRGRFHKELGLVLSRVTRPNLGLILRSSCYSAGLGLDLSPKISLKLGRVL